MRKTGLFVVDVKYRIPKKRTGFDVTDWHTKRINGYLVKAVDHEEAALLVAKWLVECNCEGVKKYPRTVEIEVTRHENKAGTGIMWPLNGDASIEFRIENETGEIEVSEKF